VKAYDDIRVLVDSIRCTAKHQQAFWHCCRETAALLFWDIVCPRIFFFFLDSTFTPTTHGTTILFKALYPQGRNLKATILIESIPFGKR